MVQEMPLISVIVPVYNVGEFLLPSLDSLAAQTYPNLEILLIDDGSTDGSGERCDEYAAKNPRFQVIHKENGGVSSARNLGLDIAKGEFVAFVDSDDLLVKDYFEVLCRDAIEYSVDLVFCNMIRVDLDGNDLTDYYLIPEKRYIANITMAIQEYKVEKGRHFSVVCSALIRADLAKQFRFQPLRFGEDTLFMFQLLFTEPTIYLDDLKGYLYISRPSSATNTTDKKSFERCCSYMKVFGQIYHSLPQVSEEDSRFFLRRYANDLVNCIAFATKLENAEEREQNYKEFRAYAERILPQMAQLPNRLRVRLTLFAKVPRLYISLLRTKDGVQKVLGK